MITKERLEELIEQGADIWKIEDGKVYQLRKDHYQYWNIKEDRLQWYCKIVPSGYCCISFNHLFETKEDAEEYEEFGNVTRTERLPYFPKYEDIEYERGHFISKFYIKDNYDGFGKLMVIKDFVILVQCSSLGVLHEEYFNKPATQENYNEARRLCVKLFKGE